MIVFQAQISHLARLMAIQFTNSGIGPGIEQIRREMRERYECQLISKLGYFGGVQKVNDTTFDHFLYEPPCDSYHLLQLVSQCETKVPTYCQRRCMSVVQAHPHRRCRHRHRQKLHILDTVFWYVRSNIYSRNRIQYNFLQARSMTLYSISTVLQSGQGKFYLQGQNGFGIISNCIIDMSKFGFIKNLLAPKITRSTVYLLYYSQYFREIQNSRSVWFSLD